MINIMIDVLKEKDPAEWLAMKMVMSQEPIPKTTKEAVDIVKKLCHEAIEQSTQNLQAENKKLKSLLAVAQEDVCSLRCPSTWKTIDGQVHNPFCDQITKALKEGE